MIEYNIINKDGMSNGAFSYQVENRGYKYFKNIFEEMLNIAKSFPRKERRKILRRFEKVILKPLDNFDFYFLKSFQIGKTRLINSK